MQQKIIDNLRLVWKNSNREILNKITIDQIVIYSFFISLIVFLVLNAFYSFVKIPILIYAIFYVVILGVSFLVFMKKRRDRIDSIYEVILNWDEYTIENKNDYVNLVQNEIDTHYNSFLWKVANWVVTKALIYQTGFEDMSLTSRLFYVTTLSFLFMFIMLAQVSIVKDLKLFTSISQRDFLFLYLDKLSDNFRFLTIFIILFEIVMIGYIMHNILVWFW